MTVEIVRALFDIMIKFLKKYKGYPYLVASLRALYFSVFNRPLFKAYQDYQFTDERLKYSHIVEAVNYARIAELPSVFFEFGCHSARTFSVAARATDYLNIKDAQLFAFDSFQGLPSTIKEEDGVFEKGEFHTAIEEFTRLVKKHSGLKLDTANIIRGYYSESLTTDLQNKLPKVGVVHIDVDLYSSTVEVLNFIKPLMVEGTVLLFDDWYCFPPGSNKGERRALEEFQANNPSFEFEDWKSYSTFGKSFFVVKVP